MSSKTLWLSIFVVAGWAIPSMGTRAGGSDKEITNTIGMKFVSIPPGKFLMGSPATEKERESDEDQHDVALTKGFHMGVYEVTQKQYRDIMGTNPSWFSATGGGKDNVAGMNTDDFPVEQVSWEDAKEFCKKLSDKERKHYRLPTEAEWEYACRAGTKTVFHYGDSASSTKANFNGAYLYGGGAKGPYLARTAKVGSYAANAFGLHDMHGNVYEWCEDWYDADYYSKSVKSDPMGPPKGETPFRISRGGCWGFLPGSSRSAIRYSESPDARLNYHGFRVVLVAAP